MLAALGTLCASALRYTSPPQSSALPRLCSCSNTVITSAGLVALIQGADRGVDETVLVAIEVLSVSRSPARSQALFVEQKPPRTLCSASTEWAGCAAARPRRRRGRCAKFRLSGMLRPSGNDKTGRPFRLWANLWNSGDRRWKSKPKKRGVGIADPALLFREAFAKRSRSVKRLRPTPRLDFHDHNRCAAPPSQCARRGLQRAVGHAHLRLTTLESMPRERIGDVGIRDRPNSRPHPPFA